MKELRPLWPYIVRYRRPILFGIVCILGCSYLRSLVPGYLGQGIDLVKSRRITLEELRDYSIFVLAVAGLAGCFLFLMRRTIIDVSREIEFDFRNDFFRRLLRLDPAFYDGQQTGELMARATNDIEAVRLVVGPAILDSVNTLFLFPLVLARMIAISPMLTLWSLIPLLSLPPIVNRLSRALHRRSREVQDQYGKLTTVVQENLAGIRVVKAYVQESSEIEKFHRENETLIDRSLAQAKIHALFFPLLRLIAGLGILVMLIAGGNQVIHHGMPVGELVAMSILFQMLVWPLIMLGWVISVIQRGTAAMERLNQIFNAQPLVEDGEPQVWPGSRLSPSISPIPSGSSSSPSVSVPSTSPVPSTSSLSPNVSVSSPSPVPSPSSTSPVPIPPLVPSIPSISSSPSPSSPPPSSPSPLPPSSTPPPTLPSTPFLPTKTFSHPSSGMRGEIQIRNLTFRYPAAPRIALEDLNIEVPAGGSLGIIGGVGSGKSTLAALLCRLYPVERGMISIDGRDLNDWPLNTLRRQVGLVFQEPFIFSETISENVAFGHIRSTLHGSDIQDSEIQDAAAWAHLHDEVNLFPEQYDTLLGERGINLSGGQKQRLALARCLVRRPRILIVDDALSAVDMQTEARILDSLRHAARGRTTIVISHRLTAVSWTNQIIVLDDGRIAERGAHSELIAFGGLYSDLHAKQQLEREVEEAV